MQLLFRSGIGIIAVVLLLGITACASQVRPNGCCPTTKKQAKRVNWRKIGCQDALKGRNMRTLRRHTTCLAKYDEIPNTCAYTAGWRCGNRQFSQPSVAYQIGRMGKRSSALCPDMLSASNRWAWDKGIREYCTPRRAYRMGLLGQPFPSVCPADTYCMLGPAYQRGYAFYKKGKALQSEIQCINKNLKVRYCEHKAFGNAGDCEMTERLREKILCLLKRRQAIEAHLRSIRAMSCMVGR